jgi:hypothetical protein
MSGITLGRREYPWDGLTAVVRFSVEADAPKRYSTSIDASYR